MHWENFGYMYAGARSTWGVKSGKICYELKITNHLDASAASYCKLNACVQKLLD